MFTLIDLYRIRESQNILSLKGQTRMIESNSHLCHFSFAFPTRKRILFDLLIHEEFSLVQTISWYISFFFYVYYLLFCVYQFLSQLTGNIGLIFCQTCYINNFSYMMNVQVMNVSSYEECFFKKVMSVTNVSVDLKVTHIRSSTWRWCRTSLLCRSPCTGRDCPETLWNLPHWKY